MRRELRESKPERALTPLKQVLKKVVPDLEWVSIFGHPCIYLTKFGAVMRFMHGGEGVLNGGRG